ncbi:hypothetical protein [uncultured Treponema sp.]|uniref:hypothetical protein n=1 Tax=uncultured Treponema sp. TaxID=162155 RepID=UPI0025D16BDB|nr:hypothetical protein [uncultured Treponema sp.]
MKKLLFLGISLSTLLLSCASQKIANQPAKQLVQQNDAQEEIMEESEETNQSPLIGKKDSVTGILKKTESGYTIVKQPKSKNRKTYVLVASENQQEVFDSLADLVEQKVSVSGTIVDAKNLWHITLSVTKIEK